MNTELYQLQNDGLWTRPTSFAPPSMPSNATTGTRLARASHSPYNYPGTAQIIITTPNQNFTGLEIYGDVLVQAANTTFTDCIFRGPRNWPSTDSAIVNCISGSCVNTVIDHCTFAPQLPNYYRNAVIGHEYTATYCRVFWCNDGFGIYTQTSLPGVATNVELAYNYTSDAVYWHGTSTAITYPSQPVGTITVTPTYGAAFTVPGYPLKADGTHNDGVQIQGGLGGSRSIWVHHNLFESTDAEQALSHPVGWADTVPQLGTQDCPKRHRYLSDTVGPRMQNGRYATNGAACIVQQNTFQFPLQDTCVVEDNWFNGGGIQNNLHTNDGGYTSMYLVYQNNHLGGSSYDSSVSASPSVYPVRIDKKSSALFVGLSTNTWYEVPPWASLVTGGISIGDAIRAYPGDLAADGNRGYGGIIYDAL